MTTEGSKLPLSPGAKERLVKLGIHSVVTLTFGQPSQYPVPGTTFQLFPTLKKRHFPVAPARSIP
jgi:hypothetical protein